MIPNVFISSTIADLHHLRDALRDVILDLGFQPVMSEHSEVGYSPAASAEASCYATMQQCQLAIVIIGRRYGSRGTSGLSITQNEFRAARSQGIPVLCLVEREVLSFKQVFESNASGLSLTFPGMEAPAESFAFLGEVAAAPTNNAILDFTSAADARHHVKKQLAHLFWELLTRRGDNIKGEIRDVLAEVKALRHSLPSPPADTRSFVRAARFLLDEQAKPYRTFLEQLCGSIEDAVPHLISNASFRDVVREICGRSITVVPAPPSTQAARDLKPSGRYRYYSVTQTAAAEQTVVTTIGITPTGVVEASESAIQLYEGQHTRLLEALRNPSPTADHRIVKGA